MNNDIKGDTQVVINLALWVEEGHDLLDLPYLVEERPYLMADLPCLVPSFLGELQLVLEEHDLEVGHPCLVEAQQMVEDLLLEEGLRFLEKVHRLVEDRLFLLLLDLYQLLGEELLKLLEEEHHHPFYQPFGEGVCVRFVL